MSVSRRLAAHRAAVASAAQAEPIQPTTETRTENPGEAGATGNNEESTMTEPTNDTAVAAARAEATATANARFSTVLASEHYAGREALAKTLLATDLTADAIVTALAASNPPPAAATTTDPDAAARAEMRDALAESGNSKIDANAGGKPAAEADTGAVWDRAIANITPARKTA